MQRSGEGVDFHGEIAQRVSTSSPARPKGEVVLTKRSYDVGKGLQWPDELLEEVRRSNGPDDGSGGGGGNGQEQRRTLVVGENGDADDGGERKGCEPEADTVLVVNPATRSSQGQPLRRCRWNRRLPARFVRASRMRARGHTFPCGDRANHGLAPVPRQHG